RQPGPIGERSAAASGVGRPGRFAAPNAMPGGSMSDALHATPIADERVTTDESAAVASPYDGHVIGRVPVCTPEHVDRAVAIAKDRLVDPLAPSQRGAALHAGVRG